MEAPVPPAIHCAEVEPVSGAPATVAASVSGAATARGTAESNPMRWVALLTCLAAAVPKLIQVTQQPELLARPRHLLWIALLLAFVAMFWAPALRPSEDCRSVRTLSWLAFHSLLALALLYTVPNGLYGVFLVIAAASVGEILPLRAAFPWIGVQTVAALPRAAATER